MSDYNDDEIDTLIKDVSILAADIASSSSLVKSIKSKTAEYESNLGHPLCLKEPLYNRSFKLAEESIDDLKLKIKSALESGDVVYAIALESIILAKLYVTNNLNQDTIRAISDLADIYYQNKLYDQASSHSLTLLKNISTLKNQDFMDLKVQSYYMIAREKISHKKYEKAHEYLRMGYITAQNHHISSNRLKSMYLKIKAELYDAQKLYLSAIESHQEFLDNQLYKDDYDFVEILLRMHHLYRSACEPEKALTLLEKADAINNCSKPRNTLTYLRIKLMLISSLESNQIDRALEVAESTINELKNVHLTVEEKKRVILIRNHYIQMLMKGMQYEKALIEQKILTYMILEETGPESIKIPLNQLQQAQILNSMGKLNGAISLFKKAIHNKRFREHMRHSMFQTKLKALLETFDGQSKAKLMADNRDIQCLKDLQDKPGQLLQNHM